MPRVIQLGYDRPFQRYLLPNEQLLWVGRPRQGVMLRADEWYTIPMTLCWGGFLIFVGKKLIGPGGVRRMISIGILGLAAMTIGVYAIVLRFFHDAWRRKHTWYALTDRRALILYVGTRDHLYGVDFVDTSDIRLKEHARARGTITFIEPKFDPYWDSGIGQSQHKSFDEIENAAEVYALIDQTRTRPSPSRSAGSDRCSAAAQPP
jgi:hypothetical protein